MRADQDFHADAKEIVLGYRHQIEEYIRRFPEFHTSLVPLPEDPFAPKIVKAMIESSRIAQVGPMAAVAGAISEFLGKALLRLSNEVVVENGGDIFAKASSHIRVGIYAGTSPLSNKVGIKIQQKDMPMGICTSSGTVGHSRSFGKVDAVTVLSKSTTLADAAATSIGNLIQDKTDFQKALQFASEIKGVLGVLIILGREMAAWGELELVEI